MITNNALIRDCLLLEFNRDTRAYGGDRKYVPPSEINSTEVNQENVAWPMTQLLETMDH